VRSSPEEDRSGVLRSVVDLQAAINRSLEEDNRRSALSAWTAGLNRIIAAVRRGLQMSNSFRRDRLPPLLTKTGAQHKWRLYHDYLTVEIVRRFFGPSSFSLLVFFLFHCL
jgi:hypothetical protein